MPDFGAFFESLKLDLVMIFGFFYAAFSWPFYLVKEFLADPVVDFFKNLFG